MRKLYVHAGNHRTGTTSVQRWMYEARAELAARGILYPNDTRRHLKMMTRLFDGRLDVAMIAQRLDEQADESEARTGVPIHTIVLSDEDICKRADLSALAPFAEAYDARFVYVVRRQDLWLESWFAQNVKWQWDKPLAHMDFEEFVRGHARFHWIDYDAATAEQERVFGAGRARLVPFERGQMPGGPITAFLGAIGVADRTGLPANDPATNRSYSPHTAEIMRRLPLDEADPPLRRVLEQAMGRADARWAERYGAPPKLMMPRDARERVMAHYAPSNARVARRLLGRETLFFDPLPERGEATLWPAVPADAEAVVDTYLRTLVEDVIEGVQKDWRLQRER